MISNSLITRGLSTTGTNTLVSSGFVTGIVEEVIEQSRRVALRLGRSSASRLNEQYFDRVQEVLVFAKLLSVNNEEPVEPIKGWVTISYDKLRRITTSAVKTAFTVVKSQVDEILIVVKRVK